MGEPTEGEAVAQTAKNEQPSRWWIAYHSWGGICLKIYLDQSGLTKLFLGTPSGSDPASASSYAGMAALIAVGAVVSGYFLSKSLVRVIESSAMARKGKLALKASLPIVYFAAAILLAAQTNPLSTSEISRTSTSKPAIPAAPSTELLVLSSTQSADGVAESDLTPQLASAWEKHGAGRIAAKLEAMAKQAGVSLPPPQIKSESTVVEAQGKRLAIIRYEINATARAIEVIGISGPNLDRVMCTRETLDEIFLTIGPCAQKVKTVHGFSIGG